jgi:hypothetical protein
MAKKAKNIKNFQKPKPDFKSNGNATWVKSSSA